MLDEDQNQAYNLSFGHNLVISGQAGTGKTFLIKQIISEQRRRNRKVEIVCSTGIASTHYGKLGAKTLHKWAGIEDGRHLNEEIVHLMRTDGRFHVVKENIQSTDLLIIDEISMISARTLGQVENLCRKIRDNEIYFGGLHVILVGDFYQLPPIANKLIGDPGNHCYKLPWCMLSP
jgi:ATP-dependent exoDNAse (exonuclease V) alpha subunit